MCVREASVQERMYVISVCVFIGEGYEVRGCVCLRRVCDETELNTQDGMAKSKYFPHTHTPTQTRTHTHTHTRTHTRTGLELKDHSLLGGWQSEGQIVCLQRIRSDVVQKIRPLLDKQATQDRPVSKLHKKPQGDRNSHILEAVGGRFARFARCFESGLAQSTVQRSA